MLAAFLKNADGSFAVGRLVIALFVICVLLAGGFSGLRSAIRTGRIPYFAGWGLSRTAYIEREKNPLYFWILFTLYCLFIPFGIYLMISGCFGFEHKSV